MNYVFLKSFSKNLTFFSNKMNYFDRTIRIKTMWRNIHTFTCMKDNLIVNLHLSLSINANQKYHFLRKCKLWNLIDKLGAYIFVKLFAYNILQFCARSFTNFVWMFPTYSCDKWVWRHTIVNVENEILRNFGWLKICFIIVAYFYHLFFNNKEEMYIHI